MNQIFLLQNQDKLFLNKQKEWVDGRDLGSLYKTVHKDEALNQLFEVNTRDFSQRIHVVACGLKANGLPDIDPADLPPPGAAATHQECLSISAVDGDDDAPSAAPNNHAEATNLQT